MEYIEKCEEKYKTTCLQKVKKKKKKKKKGRKMDFFVFLRKKWKCFVISFYTKNSSTYEPLTIFFVSSFKLLLSL